jgi:hypothetical protein
VSSEKRQQVTSITDGSSISGNRQLKESAPRLASGRPQPPAVGLDDRAAVERIIAVPSGFVV